MSTVAHPNTDRWSNRRDRDANQQQDSSSISILGLLSSGLSRRSFNFCGHKDSRFARLNSGNEMIALSIAGDVPNLLAYDRCSGFPWTDNSQSLGRHFLHDERIGDVGHDG